MIVRSLIDGSCWSLAERQRPHLVCFTTIHPPFLQGTLPYPYPLPHPFSVHCEGTNTVCVFVYYYFRYSKKSKVWGQKDILKAVGCVCRRMGKVLLCVLYRKLQL